ncbi:MAG: tetratricopeptide repeat protein [Rothia sp. (in: high G+C Gram-positive bacteria)]|nr:tetratricopeptide repeat protein [Rothia sp. (in: high G+C Gram-positive bacteria)]
MAGIEDQNLPASVRNALDLGAVGREGVGEAADSPGVSSERTEASATASWRLDVTDVAQFQQLLQESNRGAVIFALWAPHSPASVQMLEQIEALVNSAEGNLLLAAVDITKTPEIGQAFQIQGVPAAIAVLAGRPAPLFTGPVEPQALTEVLGQVVQLAAQQGLPGGFEPVLAEKEKPLPPLHQEAIDALDRGDYQGAEAAYQKALNESPGDKDAKIGLAQVHLLHRVSTMNLVDERQKAAADPTDVQAQMNVADLDVAGGHVEDAFNRLIALFKAVDAETKTSVRERLLELFEVVGASDPRVIKARSALMMALF